MGILNDLANGNFKEAIAGIAAMQSEINAIMAPSKEELSTDDDLNQKRICCNPECGWTGVSADCVHPKHWPEDRLCPKCNETTEVLLEESLGE